MEKKIWSKPEMNEFAFAANEYVAACGDEHKKYLFTCDGGGGEYGGVWLETDGDANNLQTDDEWVWNNPDNHWQGGYVDEGDTRISRSERSYHACGKTHEASTTDDFLFGWFKGFTTGIIKKVIIWRGSNGGEVHCTENLDINSWTTAKS